MLTINNTTITTADQRDALVAKLMDLSFSTRFTPGQIIDAYGNIYIVMDPTIVSESFRSDLANRQRNEPNKEWGIVLRVDGGADGHFLDVFYWDDDDFKPVKRVVANNDD